MFSKDPDERVRIAIEKIKPPEKQKAPTITQPVKEEKKGFFGKLFE